MMLIHIQKNWYLPLVKEKKPISLFTNKDIEYLAFPTIFCGERCKRRDVTVHYSEICKYELRSVDRRVEKKCAKHVLQVEEGTNEIY